VGRIDRRYRLKAGLIKLEKLFTPAVQADLDLRLNSISKAMTRLAGGGGDPNRAGLLA